MRAPAPAHTSTQRAAELLDLEPDTVSKLCATGKLDGYRERVPGGGHRRWRVSLTDINRYKAITLAREAIAHNERTNRSLRKILAKLGG